MVPFHPRSPSSSGSNRDADMSESQDLHCDVEAQLPRTEQEVAEEPPTNQHGTKGGRMNYSIEAADAGWRLVYDELKRRDHRMVKDYREEVDTLLVFAGLFSAVLTAFVVESYQSLDRDYTRTSADILLNISLQLSNSSAPPVLPLAPFTPTPSNVRVNICWFLGLVFSLAVALFSFLVKQWLREYISWTDALPYQTAVGIRQFRYEGMMQWKLPGILTSLPLLLQLALILFFIGLVDFLLHLQRVVASVILVLVLLCLLTVIVTTFLPVVASTCPFRSPISTFLVHIRVQLLSFLREKFLRRSFRWEQYFEWLPYDEVWRVRWKDLDVQQIDHRGGNAHKRSIYYLWTVCQDETILSKLSVCLYGSTDKGQRTLFLSSCLPILSALGGFYNVAGGLKAAPILRWRVMEIPVALRHILAETLFEAVASLQTPWNSSKVIETMGIIPTMLYRTRDGALVANYIALLHAVVPIVCNGVGSEDRANPNDAKKYLDDTTQGIRDIMPWWENPEWEEADTVKLVENVSSFVARYSSAAIMRQTHLIDELVKLALRAAAYQNFDITGSRNIKTLQTFLSVCGECVHGELPGWIGHLQLWHYFHVLVARNRQILPTSLVRTLARNVDVELHSDCLISEEEWQLIRKRLVDKCQYWNCQHTRMENRSRSKAHNDPAPELRDEPDNGASPARELHATEHEEDLLVDTQAEDAQPVVRPKNVDGDHERTPYRQDHRLG